MKLCKFRCIRFGVPTKIILCFSNYESNLISKVIKKHELFYQCINISQDLIYKKR